MFLFCCHTYETENCCWLFDKPSKPNVANLVSHNLFEDGLLIYLFIAFIHADSSGTSALCEIINGKGAFCRFSSAYLRTLDDSVLQCVLLI